jgi:hypothetical protein
VTGRPTTLERSYELAASDACGSFTEVLRTLIREGYGDARSHLDGNTIRAKLKGLIEARKRRVRSISS